MAILVKRGSYSDNFVSEGVGIQFYCSNFSLTKLILQSNKTLAKNNVSTNELNFFSGIQNARTFLTEMLGRLKGVLFRRNTIFDLSGLCKHILYTNITFQKKFFCLIHLTRGRPEIQKRLLSCEEYRF